ncbi:MAG: choice-of-anchor tandem repeat GloVer-containing protein [Bryobacteraceae bacterium]
MLDPSGRETVLYTFTGGADGGYPNGVILDEQGNLYGTTAFGGSGSLTGQQEGVVFKLDQSGTETVLYSFTGLSDGGNPEAGVIRDAAGNLYGTTVYGGLNNGVVFEISAAGTYAVLHSFSTRTDGRLPEAGVVRDAAGNLYGTDEDYGPGGGGVVYKLDPAGAFTVLHAFPDYGAGGGGPNAVTVDAAGNLYGTTSGGGSSACDAGCGIAFSIDASRNFSILHTFTGESDGAQPYAGLTLDPAGDLYGTTTGGGQAGAGVLFKVAVR